MTRRWKLIAFFLPLAGLTLILPPFVRIFSNSDELFGVPSVILYMFAVWAALIITAYFLQSRQPETDDVAVSKDITSDQQDND